MTLREARVAFSKCLAALILQMNSTLGYEACFDDVKARDGHMKNSLHELGLAGDVNLYKDGAYLTLTEDHLPFGEWWEELGESLGLPLRWGGRFKDGNHYSLEWEGRK